MSSGGRLSARENKNTFQWNAYRLLKWLLGGGVFRGGVCPGRVSAQGGVSVSQHALGRGVSAPVHTGFIPPL